MAGPTQSFSRRRLLALAGAAVAAPSLARADGKTTVITPDRDLQGAGFFRRMIGAIEVTLVSDGAFAFNPPYPLFGENVGEEKVRAALEAEFIDYGNVGAQVSALLIRSGKDVVLVDTGCGELFGPSTGKLLSNLANAGVAASDITAVVITHAHGDHVGGLLSPRGVDVFPNAHYFAHTDEVAFWSGTNPDLSKSGIAPADQAGFIQGAQRALKNMAPKLTLLGDSLKIVDGVDAVPAPGHTPGHLTLMISSGGEHLYYIADTVHHHALTLAHPGFHMAFDTDRDAGVASRKRVLDRAASDKLLVAGAHLPFPGFGHVRRTSDGFGWVPSVWQW